MIHLIDRSNHWYLIWEIDSEFEYECNNESNENPTPLLDQNQPGPSAPRWGWRIITASWARKIGRSGGWCRMINSRAIPLENLLAFSLTTNPHLRLTLEKFWFKNSYLFFPFILGKQEPVHLMWLFTWLFFFNSTQGVESIKHLFKIFSKAQLFGAPNICSFIIWPGTWLLLFTLSILPPINLVELLALGWSFTKSLQSNSAGFLLLTTLIKITTPYTW